MTQVFNLHNNIDLYINDALKLNFKHKFSMIYFDPPFNSDRDYVLNYDNDLGFSDKWTNEDYEKFITLMIDKLYEMLEKDGTLFFHISSSCMFIPEKVLRNKFKYVELTFIAFLVGFPQI